MADTEHAEDTVEVTPHAMRRTEIGKLCVTITHIFPANATADAMLATPRETRVTTHIVQRRRRGARRVRAPLNRI